MKGESVLRQSRIDQDKTIKEVADAVGMSLAGYQQVETGRNAVASDQAEKIAKYFGRPIDAFFVPKYYTVRKVTEA